MQESALLESVVGGAEAVRKEQKFLHLWFGDTPMMEVWGMIQRTGKNGSVCVLQEEESWEADHRTRLQGHHWFPSY